MSRPDYQNQVLAFIESKPKGTLFINSDFFHIAESSTIRQILKRLVDDNKLTRILDGMYGQLEFSKILNKDIYPSPVDVAHTLARKFKWQIYPSKHTALNIVGLSNQVTNSYEFLSDGPYKKYVYLNYEIIFKKSANKKIKMSFDAFIFLIIALDSLGKDKITYDNIKIISNYIKKQNITSDIIDQAKTIPEWMYLTLTNIVKENS